MEHFTNALTVRLRSHHKTYLSANPRDDDDNRVKLRPNSRAARWTVELVSNSPDLICLRSSTGHYLTATNTRFLLGATGRKVVLTPASTAINSPTITWRPIRDGPDRLKLQSPVYGTFLRANGGGVKPYKGSVTHDVPQVTMTQEWVLWVVDVLELGAAGRVSPPLHPPAHVAPLQHSQEGGNYKRFGFGSRSGSESEGEQHAASPSVKSLKSTLSRLSPKSEGRKIQYYIMEEGGKLEDQMEEWESGCFIFQGTSVRDLTCMVEELTGLKDVILCVRDVINNRLLRLRLNLPPDRRDMTLVVVPCSSPVVKSLDA